jgi:hypothetical protein
MIGFEMKAEGSNGFRQKRGAWTEGSLMALKVIARAGSFANKDRMGGVQSGALSSIEASFKKIADNLFRSVCSAGLDLTLFVTGDLEFKYVFESGKSADQVMSELLNLMAAQESEMGDQVMIAFCRTIENFIMLNFDSKQQLVLTIDIDL